MERTLRQGFWLFRTSSSSSWFCPRKARLIDKWEKNTGEQLSAYFVPGAMHCLLNFPSHSGGKQGYETRPTLRWEPDVRWRCTNVAKTAQLGVPCRPLHLRARGAGVGSAFCRYSLLNFSQGNQGLPKSFGVWAVTFFCHLHPLMK